MTVNVGIYVYDNAEVLDFSGPFEVFSTASRVAGKPVFQPFLIAEKNEPVVARGGYRVLPDYAIDSHPSIHLLVVVGGVHTGEMGKSAVLEWIAAQSTVADITASVCTGVFLLAAAGVVTDQRVTTHWEDLDDLARQYPQLRVRPDVRWVDEGQWVSSGGISAGIDMSLHLVRRLGSAELAEATAHQMEYRWVDL